MSKILKIKESAVLGVIKKIINEQASSEITITASNELGTHPGFSGLKELLKELKTNVQNALRGATPYKIKSTSAGTVKTARQGNQLVLSVTLIPTEESQRHWFFEGAAGIYSYFNTTSMGPLTSAVKLKVMEKARASFPAVQILGLFPDHISLKGFTNLNSVEPTKEYKVIIEYLTANKPEGYQEVGADETQPKTDAVKPEVAATATAPKPETKPEAATKPEVAPETKQTINEVVSSGYTATNCDELHAFQGTGGKVIGNMNVIVGNKLEELYKKGINPRVSSVEVKVKGMRVDWTCTITESNDGKAWVGFTSRGAGCNNDVKTRSESAEFGNDPATMVEKIKSTYGEDDIEYKKLYATTVNYGKNTFRQVFYIYTKPKNYPAK